MVVEDKLYFGCSHGDKQGFYCLNATTGEIIWVHDPITPYAACTPAIVDGKVYIGNGWYFYCLNAETGAEIWNSQDKSDWGSAAVFNNRVYTNYDKLYCLDAENGDELWNYPNGDIYCSPAIAYGNVYVGNNDGKVYCFDSETGDLIWESISLGFIYASDVAVADDKVFIAVGGHETLSKLVCLDAYTGEVLWDCPLGGMYCIYSAPAVAYGNVYVGAGENGYFYAFGTPNEPPETPSIPDGPSEGIVGVEYTFDTSTTDPEGDDVYYLFDWGDGTNSGWQGPYASGVTVDASHIWTEKGDYEIRAKAHDGRRESNWSERHTISIIGSEPDLECDGSLSWTDIKPGETVEGNFTLLNTGEPYSLLNWEIESYPEWGIWSFNPQEGTDLTPEDDPITVIVNVTAPDEKNSEFEGEIKIINKGNSSDFCTIDISLATPKNKAFNFNFPLLEWLFERFPYAFPILRYILAL